MDKSSTLKKINNTGTKSTFKTTSQEENGENEQLSLIVRNQAKLIAQHNKNLLQLDTKLNENEKKLKEFEITSTKLTDLINKATIAMDQKETRVNEILAMFIGLFTFISVNVSIFTRVKDVSTGVWFMFIMTFCVILIVSVLFIFINKTSLNWQQIAAFISSILVLIFLLLYSSIHKFEMNQISENSNIQVNQLNN